MDSREEVQLEQPSQRRGARLPRPRLRRGEAGPPSRIDPLLKKVRTYNPKADLKELQRAFEFAEGKHEGQKRMSGEDFIEHPLAVAGILADLHLDTTTLMSALLHDTVEDTDVTVDDIDDEFGDEVGRIVDGLTKLEKYRFKTREQQQAENVRKMIVAMAGDIRVLLIKLADRLHNMRTLGSLAPEKQRRDRHRDPRDLRAAREPPRRAGDQVGARGSVLQDAAPRSLPEIANLVETRRGERQRLIEEVTDALRTKLKELGIKADVEGRPKHLYSIYEKMVIRGKEFNEIYDLVGIRILVESLRDTYGGPRRRPRPVEAHPRALQGLRRDAQVEHVPVAAHDGRGARGQAARDPDPHARHAPHGAVRDRRALAVQGGRSRRATPRDLAWLGQMIEWLKDMADPREFMEGLQIDLSGGRVFVFTPKGDVVNLPAGRHAGRLRLRDPHRGRPPDGRREGRRQARAARLRAADRRLGRDPHLEGPGRGPVPGLAAVRRDAARAEQDPPVVRAGAPRGRARAGSRRCAAR